MFARVRELLDVRELELAEGLVLECLWQNGRRRPLWGDGFLSEVPNVFRNGVLLMEQKYRKISF